MIERPILFSGSMVRAILGGRKTQTRRVITPQPQHGVDVCPYCMSGWASNNTRGGCTCRNASKNSYGHPGDRLWVREAIYHYGTEYKPDHYEPFGEYVADGARFKVKTAERPKAQAWWGKAEKRIISAGYMPRWAGRITLEVVDVRVERVQESFAFPRGCANARREGIQVDCPVHHMGSVCCCSSNCERHAIAFRNLWDSINAKRGYGWDKNPWVWVVEFRRVEA